MSVEKDPPSEDAVPTVAAGDAPQPPGRSEAPPQAVQEPRPDAPAAGTSASAPAQEPERGWRRRMLTIGGVILAVLIALGVGGGVAWSLLSDRMMALERANDDVTAKVEAFSRAVDASNARSAPLGSRIEAVAAEIAQIRQSVGPAAQLAAKVEDLDRRLTQIDQQVQTMAARHLAASELNDRLTRLETQAVRSATIDQRLQAVEAGGKTLSRAAEVVLAIGQISGAMRDSNPFVEELRMLQVIAARDQAVMEATKALEPYAAKGVPTFAQLAAEFPAVAVKVNASERKTGEGEWHERVLSRLTTLVSVRRTGPAAVAEGGTAGALAEAEAQLAAGELAPAVTAVEQIEGPGGAAAASWLAAARSRLAADAALVRLEDRALVNLSDLKRE